MAGGSVATSGTKKKKKKGFVKSIAKGLSFKKKKQRPDDDSVVGVALDRGGGGNSATPPRSVGGTNNGSAAIAPSPSTTNPTPKPIQVVLLLMDPSSRRFELLQLEFDSTKARVSDVIQQIQSSATESTLRDMKYVGVCDVDGTEMISIMKLSQFCKGNDMVMAIPEGLTGEDTANLAGPILDDPKVEDMLAPCGVKLPKVAKKKSRKKSPKLTQISEEDIDRKEKKNKLSPKTKSPVAKKTSSSSSLPTMILGMLLSTILFFTIQRHISVTKPIASGDVLLPGQWKSTCGIFDLVPSDLLEKLPMDKLSSRSCSMTLSSKLELGKDGTLRYFTKSDDDERKVVWSVEGGGEQQCSNEGEDTDEQCFEKGATFIQSGNYWYVDMGGVRTSLNKDVIRDFTN